MEKGGSGEEKDRTRKMERWRRREECGGGEEVGYRLSGGRMTKIEEGDQDWKDEALGRRKARLKPQPDPSEGVVQASSSTASSRQTLSPKRQFPYPDWASKWFICLKVVFRQKSLDIPCLESTHPLVSLDNPSGNHPSSNPAHNIQALTKAVEKRPG